MSLFDKKGIHRITDDKFDEEGYDKFGFDKKGIHRITDDKFDEEGHNRTEYDHIEIQNNPSTTSHSDSQSLTILKTRLAKGEITLTEFNKLKSVIE